MTDTKIKSAIVILGHQNDSSGELSNVAKERCHRALELFRDHGYPLICTGDQGEKFNNTATPHGLHLQHYLIAQGVPATAFLPFSPSHNTYEDGKLTAQTVKNESINKLLLVTSDFHLKRAFLWFKLFMPLIEVQPFGSTTICDFEQRKTFDAHEKFAIKQFYRDFPDFPEAGHFFEWHPNLV